MAQRKFRVSPQPFTVDVEEIPEQQGDNEGSLLLITIDPDSGIPTRKPSDIIGVYRIPLPVPAAGEFLRGIDPRVGDNSAIFRWLVVTDKLYQDEATSPNLPDLTNMQELAEIWNYELVVTPVQDAPATRTRYTAVNTGLNQKYGFTSEFVQAGTQYFTDTLGPDYTATVQTQAATNVTYNMFFQGGPIPADTLADARQVMADYMTTDELENRRYYVGETLYNQLLSAQDGILERVWDSTGPELVDGYTR